jgi:GTP-binding protein Era
MNTIIGEKVAIVSNKPQTTRNRITGIYTEGDSQYVFLDTPGMHKPKTKLGEYMMKSADETLSGTDVIVYMTESGQLPEKADIEIIEKIKNSKIPALLVINKTDAGKRDKLLLTIDKFSKLHDFVSVIPISALFNDGVDIVMKELAPFLKEERWYFPDDIITDMPEREICSEIIREKLLRTMDDEIPHGTAVVIEDFKEGAKLIEIRAEIYCEKNAHKKMIIGKNGETLKKIATFAREDMEAFFGTKVYLNLWVKVKEKWRDNQLSLNNFGFKPEDLEG